MSILLRNALVLDTKSSAFNNLCNIHIEKGIINSLNGSKARKEIDLQGKPVSIGWCDLNAHFNDPGFEFKEDIESGVNSAAFGGFTDVCLIPSTSPIIESKSQVDYIINKASQGLDLHVCAALSEN